MRVKATMTIDEAVAVGPLIYARVAGRYGFLMMYLVIGTFGGVIIGSLIATILPISFMLSGWIVSPSILSILLPAIEVVSGIAGLWIGSQRANRKYVNRYVDRLIERGHRREGDIVFELLDGGLSISGGGIRHVIDWTAFLEIGPAPQHWLLITGPLSFILPRRAFATEKEERAFLASLLERLPAETRNRSVEASAFAR